MLEAGADAAGGLVIWCASTLLGCTRVLRSAAPALASRSTSSGSPRVGARRGRPPSGRDATRTRSCGRRSTPGRLRGQGAAVHCRFPTEFPGQRATPTARRGTSGDGGARGPCAAPRPTSALARACIMPPTGAQHDRAFKRLAPATPGDAHPLRDAGSSHGRDHQRRYPRLARIRATPHGGRADSPLG